MEIVRRFIVLWRDGTLMAVVEIEARDERAAVWESSSYMPPGAWAVAGVREVETATQPGGN